MWVWIQPGQSLLMALMLAIGFLVDDAIVFLENTVRRMEEGERPSKRHSRAPRKSLYDSCDDDLAGGGVPLPLVLMPGLIGRIFREFSITIIVSIFAAASCR